MVIGILIPAVLCDIKGWHISNKIIIIGSLAGLLYQMIVNETGQILIACLTAFLAIGVMFPLFYIRALGAGDIKLISITALFIPIEKYVIYIAISFIVAAVISLIRMIFQKNLYDRLVVLVNYTILCMQTGKVMKYRNTGEISKSYCIHFSVALLIGYLIYMGVKL